MLAARSRRPGLQAPATMGTRLGPGPGQPSGPPVPDVGPSKGGPSRQARLCSQCSHFPGMLQNGPAGPLEGQPSAVTKRKR